MLLRGAIASIFLIKNSPRPPQNFFNKANFERLGRRGEGSENFGKWFLHFEFISIKRNTNFSKIRCIVC